MLESIYKIGKVSKNEKLSLISPINADYVIGIIFETNGSVRYKKSELFEFKDPSLYLFKRDYSGRPGLFLTGNISRTDIERIQKIIENDPSAIDSPIIKKFVNDKILWFPRGKLVNNNEIFDCLPEDKKIELGYIFEELKQNQKIPEDVLKILTKDSPKRTLITIMFQKEGDPKFVGQISAYKDLFKKGVLSKKFQPSETLVCCSCNEKKIIETFTEKPLPFFTADKAMFFPDANTRSSKKGFPLCDECFLELQKGIQFIQDNLNYSISSLGSKRSELNFWLVPHLNDQKLIQDFAVELKNKNLYLNSLKDLCSTLKSISKSDIGSKDIESFLRFSALFYNMDSHALMRTISYTQGIYPSRLQKLIKVKEVLDKKFPFEILNKKFKKTDFYFGFPLFVYFFKNTNPQWQNQMISILNNIFTTNQIPTRTAIQNVVQKIRDTAKSFNMGSLMQTTFLGLLFIEFLIYLEGSTIQEEHLKQDSDVIIKEIEYIQKFIESHKNIINNDTSRAIFAVGVCVGILLEVQSQLYNKTAPFWNRLNRLDLDLIRISQLFPQVKSKLVMYDERSFDTVINYLGANEISNLDINSKITKDSINLIFSIGLSVGYLIKRKYFD